MITLLNKFDDNYIMKENDIYDVAWSYIKANNLESYLSDIFFDTNSKHLGYYNIKTKEIVLNDKKIIAFGYHLFDKLQNKFTIDENFYTYYLNFYYLYIIYHELTHVNQRAKYEMSFKEEKEIFNYLYELCFKLRHSDILFYKANHDIFPMEIDANNNGYLTAYNLMNYTKLPRNETKIMHSQYLFSLIHNYQKTDEAIFSPIEKLSLENNNVNLYEIFDLARQTDLSKIERLNLGLPITIKEYDGIVKEKSLIKTI